MMRDRNIGRPGYKETKVGWIPEDWECTRFDRLIHLQRGFDLPQSLRKDGTIPVFASNGLIGYHDEAQVSAPGIVTGRSGSIGKVSFVTQNFWPLNTTLFVTNYYGNDPLYSFYFLHYFRLERFANGTGVPTLNRNDIHPQKIPLPPLPEQEAIAEVLECWDKAIRGYEKKIDKKKNIKKGLMQRLLSGKQRLPGFEGEWREVRLGDVCELITKGTTPTSIGRSFQDSGVSFVKIESLDLDGQIIKNKLAFIDKDTHSMLKRSQLKEDDILVSIAGALGRIAIVKDTILPANTNQALALVRLHKDSEVDTVYLYWYLNGQQIKSHIKAINVQAAQANLSLRDIAEFKILHPAFKEQHTIASVLTSANAEISALKRKLASLKEQKRFLLNNLVTGTIRLPDFNAEEQHLQNEIY